MSESNRNPHLNLFNFFNNNDTQTYENNLTRALALCLEYDDIFLFHFLNKVDPEWESFLVKTDENRVISINIQRRVNEIQSAVKVVGVALTSAELPDTEKPLGQGSEDSITDMVIQINDLFIVVEVKRTNEDCRAQLQKQLDIIKQESIDPNLNLETIQELTWNEVINLIAKTDEYRKSVGNRNIFTSEFLQFVELKQPSWVEVKNLAEIPFPETDNDSHPQIFQINRRLNFLKSRIADSDLQFNRQTIPVKSYPWVNEINIMPMEKDEEGQIFIGVWPGDTKGQGYSIFKNDESFDWPQEILGYPLVVEPYLKFAHFNAGVSWVFPSGEIDPKTHTKSFFDKYVGKWIKNHKYMAWKKAGVKWADFDTILEDLKPDWKTVSRFNDEFQQSGRNYFYVSTGFAVKVLIPYHEAQKLDHKSTSKNYPLAQKLSSISEQLLIQLDQVFST